MGTFRHRRSVRWLAITAAAAAAASGLSVLGGIGIRVAAANEFVFVNGDLITDGPTPEPVFVEGQTVGHFFDTGTAAGTGCNTEQFTATINWGDGAESPGTITCTPVLERPATAAVTLPTLPEYNVQGSHEYKDSGTYDITIAVTDTTDHANEGAKTDSATVSDRTLLNDDGSNVKAVEGQTVTVTNFFYDNNRAYSCNSAVDPGITATIDWGDGTKTTNVKPAPPNSDGCDDFTVTGTHVYDAEPDSYIINITVTDDGGQTQDLGDFPLMATISDAALTAGADKSLSETAGAISNGAVGSFTDAAGAQASAADFSAVIDWGDKSTSVGTVSHTGSGAAFDVSGAHGYATAGTKTITTTVTDQEGQSVTMKATVTVNAAPAPIAAALPTTGQPQQPSSPLPLALLILGAMAILGAGGTLLFRRTTR